MGILRSVLAVSVTVVLSLGGCRLVDSVFVAALCLYENVLSCRWRVVELSNLFEVALTYCCMSLAMLCYCACYFVLRDLPYSSVIILMRTDGIVILHLNFWPCTSC